MAMRTALRRYATRRPAFSGALMWLPFVAAIVHPRRHAAAFELPVLIHCLLAWRLFRHEAWHRMVRSACSGDGCDGARSRRRRLSVQEAGHADIEGKRFS